MEANLAARVRAGDRRALAQALTAIENGRPESREILAALFPHGGGAMVVGLTGPPGVGKSTLADALAKRGCLAGRRVAVLAMDPTSLLTGGAVLADRLRMEEGSRDPEIFIRSMATRGQIGGLSATAFEAIALLEGSGKDFILVETVGVGQDEVEIAAAAGLTLVVLAPGLGDEIQASKAGLTEIADIVVVNKADRDGADRLARDLQSALGSRVNPPPVLATVATSGEGVDELVRQMDRLWATAQAGSHSRRGRFLEGWLRLLVCRAVLEETKGKLWEEVLKAVAARSLDPFAAAEKILNSIRSKHNR